MPLQNTRLKVVPMATKTKGTSNPLTWSLDKAGILRGIRLSVRGNIAGTISSPNALGKCCIIRRVTLFANSQAPLHSYSGVGYHRLIRDNIAEYDDVGVYTDARDAVAAGDFKLDIYIPVTMNLRDEAGLVLLQNEQTTVYLGVEFEADANVATGITSLTATVKPTLEFFSLPASERDWPDLRFIHQIVEEQIPVAGAGDVEYTPPRGNTYLQILMGLGLGVSGADNWSAVKLTGVASDQIETKTPEDADIEYALSHGRARALGVIPMDWLGSSGLGCFGSARDVLYSQNITDLKIVVTATASGTLYVVRRQLVALTPAA